MKFSEKVKIFLKGKSNYIKIRINNEDRSTSIYYINRKDITFEGIKIRDMLYKLDNKKMVYEEGFRTFIYNFNDPTPLDYINTQITEITAEEYRTAIDEKVTRNIIAAGSIDFDKIFKFVLIQLALTAIGFGLIYYQFSTILNEQAEMIATMQEQLDAIGQIIAGGR